MQDVQYRLALWHHSIIDPKLAQLATTPDLNRADEERGKTSEEPIRATEYSSAENDDEEH